MRHIISVRLENESGALSRVSGLFSARGFNIESLTVASTNDPTLSRMTIVSIGNDTIIDQIVKQLNKLVDVVTVTDLTSSDHIERELALVKVEVDSSNQAEIEAQVAEYAGKVIDAGEDVYTVEIAGQAKRINDFLAAIDADKIIEVSRTGVTGVRKNK